MSPIELVHQLHLLYENACEIDGKRALSIEQQKAKRLRIVNFIKLWIDMNYDRDFGRDVELSHLLNVLIRDVGLSDGEAVAQRLENALKKQVI